MEKEIKEFLNDKFIEKYFDDTIFKSKIKIDIRKENSNINRY
jgi:hypothetical protein